MERQASEENFDRAALLGIVEGDLHLLQELIKVFLVDTPRLLTDLRVAVERITRGRRGAG